MAERNDKLRERIKALLDAGKSQREIAEKLDLVPSAVAYHVRKLGIPAKVYGTPLPIKNGKRECARCRERKVIGSFPSKYHAVCTACYQSTPA
jgi:hypothetical protein